MTYNVKILDVSIDGSNSARITFQLNDVKLKDGSLAQYQMEFSTSDYQAWLSNNPSGTIQQYLEQKLGTVIDGYNATKTLIASLEATTLSWG